MKKWIRTLVLGAAVLCIGAALVPKTPVYAWEPEQIGGDEYPENSSFTSYVDKAKEGEGIIVQDMYHSLYQLDLKKKEATLIELQYLTDFAQSNMSIKYEGVWYPITQIGQKQKGEYVSVVSTDLKEKINTQITQDQKYGIRDHSIYTVTIDLNKQEGIWNQDVPDRDSFDVRICENAFKDLKGGIVLNYSGKGNIEWGYNETAEPSSVVGSDFDYSIYSPTLKNIQGTDQQYGVRKPEIVHAPATVKTGEPVSILLKEGTYSPHTQISIIPDTYACGEDSVNYSFQFKEKTDQGGVFELCYFDAYETSGKKVKAKPFTEEGSYTFRILNGNYLGETRNMSSTFTIHAEKQDSSASYTPQLVSAPGTVTVNEKPVEITLKKGTYQENTLFYSFGKDDATSGSQTSPLSAKYWFVYKEQDQQGNGIFELHTRTLTPNTSVDVLSGFDAEGTYKFWMSNDRKSFASFCITVSKDAPQTPQDPTLPETPGKPEAEQPDNPGSDQPVPSAKKGWIKTDGIWQYVQADGSLAKGWMRIDGTWYLFDQNGNMKTGWVNEDGTWYMLGSDGAMKTGWYCENGVWYYFSGSGAMQKEWQKIQYNGAPAWFWFDSAGAMKTGWLKLFWNDQISWYYFNADGTMLSNGTLGSYRFDSAGICLNP